MQGKRITSIIIVCLLSGMMVRSQQMITLQDAIAAALKNNYDIQLVSNDSAAAAIDKHYIYGGFYPR